MGSLPRSPADPLVGTVLGERYRLEAVLGRGGSGAVYRARHVRLGRPFAVKLLHPRLLANPKIARRFEREAALAGRLSHRNVVAVIDLGVEPDGLRYMVMDLVDGRELEALLAEAPLPPPRIVHLTRQLLDGLFHAHQAGLIHRDLKPSNAIVQRDDNGEELVRIVDFGTAIVRDAGVSFDAEGRLTTSGLVLGTPDYMAPEQATASPLDHRVDLFALGIVIYEMLSGRMPFDGTGAEIARANATIDPPPIAVRVPHLEVDPLLEAFARRLMRRSRDQRPATAAAARALLDRIVDDPDAAAAELGVPLGRGPADTERLTVSAVLGAPGARARLRL